MDKKIQVGIVGARGYTGAECLRLVSSHPYCDVITVCSTSKAGKTLASEFPQITAIAPKLASMHFTEYRTQALAECDLVFFATPHRVAAEQVPHLLDQGKKVIDLSADFRIQNKAVWEEAYGVSHPSFDIVKNAVYGIPEFEREALKTASLVANPGCYPTAIALALSPLLQKKAIETNGIIADCKSGLSGAGRKLAAAHLLTELQGNFYAYGLPKHRHLPEIEELLCRYGSCASVGISFAPHLLPIPRGILATLYVSPIAAHASSSEQVHQILSSQYQDEQFVSVLPYASLPQISMVTGTNHCVIGVIGEASGKTVIVSVIDNLVKGAAGQAVQNANAMYGWDEATGLTHIPPWP